MTTRRTAAARLAGLVLVATACSATAEGEGADPARTSTSRAPAESVESVDPDDTTASPTTTDAPSTTDDDRVTTTDAATTTTSSTTTTSTLPPLDVYDPLCVVQVQPGDSLQVIADRFDDETVSAASLQAENRLDGETIFPEQLIDVCVDNGVNDITGEAITERNSVLLARDVMEQQTKLNELFAGLGIRELLVDGISGPVTRQRICAWRLANGLPVSTEDIVPDSEEEALLFASTGVPVPFTSSILSPRWILIDRTCQIMFVGEGTDRLVFVFPTSTGEPGYETRDQDLTPVFRFNPALDNGGWHNSSTYPVAEDNPLNGNMYKPLYFDRGQAIHGANNVPTSPQSKGCARLRVEHQDLLVGWLGLADSGPTTSRSRINVTVNVQGAWVPR